MKKVNLLILIAVSVLVTFSACTKEGDDPASSGSGSKTPTEDYFKVNSTIYTKAEIDTVIVSENAGKTTLRVNVGNGLGFVEFVHAEIVENKVYTGFWVADGDSSVRIWSRLGFNVGDPNFFPEKPNGTYIMKRENNKRVSIFENIECFDGIEKKTYTVSGRITWPN